MINEPRLGEAAQHSSLPLVGRHVLIAFLLAGNSLTTRYLLPEIDECLIYLRAVAPDRVQLITHSNDLKF